MQLIRLHGKFHNLLDLPARLLFVNPQQLQFLGMDADASTTVKMIGAQQEFIVDNWCLSDLRAAWEAAAGPEPVMDLECCSHSSEGTEAGLR